jgi:hypothetical protein
MAVLCVTPFEELPLKPDVEVGDNDFDALKAWAKVCAYVLHFSKKVSNVKKKILNWEKTC